MKCGHTETLINRLTKLADKMVLNKRSEHPEDYPKSAPKSVLKRIQNHNEFMNCCINEIKGIEDRINEIRIK